MLRAGLQLTKLQRAPHTDASNGRSNHSKERDNNGSALESTTASNVERFLESVTPSVPAHHYFSKTGSDVVELQQPLPPYFLLGDVWESFAEWSAYGTGVTLSLNNNTSYKDRVIQYYVPSLSAIQIYAPSHTLSSSLQPRRPGEESDSDFKDSSSSEESSSESETGGLCYQKDQISASMDQKEHLEESYSDDGEPLLCSQGRLIFEYLERDLPYIREPFADKMSDLASTFPELKTMRSCDLLPSSWFSVAWYPIYKIPTGPTVKDLDACFLTYHSLHTPFQGESVTTQSMCEVQSNESVEKTTLPIFGLASYKLRGSVWTSIKGPENQLVNSLFQAADSWLRLHQVNHPDFIFFSR